MNSSDVLQRGATTAKEFFGIIFNTKEDDVTKRWLDEMLHKTNLQDGEFSKTCHKRAETRLREIGGKIDMRESLSEHKDVSDKDLAQIRNLIKTIWPFVKSVTIATGHVLLRNGLCFFDLPGKIVESRRGRTLLTKLGYGDTSQLRETVINEFRRRADLEMVVVPYSRLQTSTVQEYYLGRSIRRMGANRTLVMNRSDVSQLFFTF